MVVDERAKGEHDMSDYNDNGAFGDASLANEQDHQIQHGRMPAAPSSGGYQQLHTEVDAFVTP